MPLTGVNDDCQDCTQECKQSRQVKVVFCPNYEKRGSGNFERHFSTQGKKSNLPQVER